MSVINRHIRRDFDRWTDHSPAKVSRSLCGQRTTEKYLGIPGVTDQTLSVAGDSGWCPNCLASIAADIREFNEENYKYMPERVREQWLSLIRVVVMASKAAGIVS